MISLTDLRRTIDRAPKAGAAASVSRRWLEEVERELVTGNAAVAELAAIRAERQHQS